MTAIMKFINREGMPKLISWKKGVLPMKIRNSISGSYGQLFCFTLLFVHALLFGAYGGYWQSLNGDAILEKGHWMILAFYLF